MDFGQRHPGGREVVVLGERDYQGGTVRVVIAVRP